MKSVFLNSLSAHHATLHAPPFSRQGT